MILGGDLVGVVGRREVLGDDAGAGLGEHVLGDRAGCEDERRGRVAAVGHFDLPVAAALLDLAGGAAASGVNARILAAVPVSMSTPSLVVVGGMTMDR